MSNETEAPLSNRPEIPTQEAWLEQIGAQPMNMGQMDDLVRESQEKWATYERLKKAASGAFVDYETTEAAIMSALKAAGKTKYHVDGVGTVSIKVTKSVTVPKDIESKKQFFKHLRERGEDVLFGLATVNSQSLNSWYRQEADQAEAEGILGFSVPGISEPSIRETLAFRKG